MIGIGQTPKRCLSQEYFQQLDSLDESKWISVGVQEGILPSMSPARLCPSLVDRQCRHQRSSCVPDGNKLQHDAQLFFRIDGLNAVRSFLRFAALEGGGSLVPGDRIIYFRSRSSKAKGSRNGRDQAVGNNLYAQFGLRRSTGRLIYVSVGWAKCT